MKSERESATADEKLKKKTKVEQQEGSSKKSRSPKKGKKAEEVKLETTSEEESEIVREFDGELKVAEKKGFFRRAWEWATGDKERLAGLIFLTCFVILIVVLASLGLNMGDIMQRIVGWFENKIGMIGIYIGIFVISTFGNFTVIFPVPYTIALVAVAVNENIQNYQILIMGLCAGAGAAIGEASAWLAGKATKEVIEGSMEKQVARAQKWIDKGLAPFIIFIFAATPLPDDAVLIFIGLLGYALWKTIIWCFIGKIVLTSGTAFIARALTYSQIGTWILWAFGLSMENGTVTANETPLWLSALTWILAILVIGVVLFVDWGAIGKRIKKSSIRRKIKRLMHVEIEQTEPSSFLELQSKFLDETSKGKRQLFSRESALWRCKITKEKEGPADFQDFLSISYVLGKPTNVILNSKWLKKFEKNLQENRFFNMGHHRIEKITMPPKIAENLEQAGKLDALKESLLLVSFKSFHPDIKMKFEIGLLLEKMEDDRIKVRCISEREGDVIQSFKASSPEEVSSKFLKPLDNLAKNPDDIQRIILANYENPIKRYKKAVEENPNDNQALYCLGNAYLEIEDFSQTIECFSKVVEIKSDDYEAWTSLGIVYAKIGEQEKAMECFEKTLEIEPECHNAWLNLGLGYYIHGNWDKAIECFQKALDTKPKSFETLTHLGNAYFKLGDYLLAIKYLKKALKIKPDSYEVLHDLGNAFSEIEKDSQAIKFYKKALKIKPDFYQAWVNIALAYTKINDLEKARECEQKAAEIKPS